MPGAASGAFTGMSAAPRNDDGRAGGGHVLAAIGWMVVAGLMSSLLHVGVRLVGPQIPTIQIVLLRSLFTLMVALPVVLRVGQLSWRTNNLRLQVVRGVIGVCSMTTWYYALTVMPLADAGALSFTTAIFVTIGAALWFREPVGWRRWTAVGAGLTGAVIVLRPGLDVISIGAVAALGSSVLWAVSLLLSKVLARVDSSLTISFYQPLMIAPIALIASLPVWVWPNGATWLLLFGMGVAAAIGNFGYIHALRLADAGITMPADYLRLLWMAGWGFLLFGEVPLLTTWLGAALIVGATLWIGWRESQLARKRRP